MVNDFVYFIYLFLNGDFAAGEETSGSGDGVI